MKIDIQIRDATPEEARQFFSTIRHQKTARRGSAKNFHNVWTPEEHEAIQNCQDRNEAWTRYHEKFPESPRTQEAVFRMWLAKKETAIAAPAHKPADDLPAETPPIVKKGAKSVGETSKATGNRYHNKWKIPFDSVKEPGKYEAARKLCRKVGKPYDEAIKAVAATPKREKPVGAVTKKGAKLVPWDPAIKKAVQECKTGPDAIKKYRELYPAVPRTDAAIYYQWFDAHRPDKKSTKKVLKKEENSTNVVHKVATSPSQYDSDKITMPEIVTGMGKIPESPDSKQSPQQPTKEQVAEKVKDLKDANAHFSPPQKPFDGIATGMHVKQIKPDAGRQIFGTATVIERHGEIVTVRNGNAKVYKILAACLQPVVGSAEKDKEGARA